MKPAYLSFIFVSLLLLLFAQSHGTVKALGPATWYAVALTQDWCESVNDDGVCTQQWHTHDLYSVGSSVASPMPKQFKVIALSGKPDLAVVQWDKQTESFIAK